MTARIQKWVPSLKSPTIQLVTAIVSVGLVLLGSVTVLEGFSTVTDVVIALSGLLICCLGSVSLGLIRQMGSGREADQIMRDSEAKYRLIANNASDMIVVLDRQFARRYVSPSSLEMLGYGAEELIGTQPLQMIHPDDAERVGAIYQEMFAGLERAETTNRIRHRDGQWIWIEASFRLIRDPRTREPLEICGSLRDITRRVAAEAAQYEAEGNFRLLAEHANDVVTRSDADGIWRYVSPAATRVFGVPSASLGGKRTLDFVHPDDRPAMLARLRRLQDGVQEAKRPTFRILRPSGEEVWLEASSHIVFDPLTDKPDGYVSILRDITERVRSEAILRDSEERYRLLLQSAVFTQAACMLDANGIVDSWNDGAERIRGYTASEIIGRHFSEFFTPEDISIDEPERQLALAKQTGSFETEAWRKRKDGSRFFAKVNIRAVRNKNGTLRGFAEMTQDITTERIEREQREIIIGSAPNGMMIADEQGLITLANAALERMFDFPSGALIGQPIETLVPDLLQRQQLDSASSDPALPAPSVETTGMEFVGRKRDGSDIPVEVLVSPVDTGAGRIIIASVFDTTERKRAEAAKTDAEMRERRIIEASNAALEKLSRHLSKARDSAERANRAKSRFLTGMSHELRTPLNGILGYAELLRLDGGLNETQSARVQSMVVAGQHLLEMITCVLDLSEIEADHVSLKSLDVDVPATAAAAVDLIRPSALAKQLALTLHVSDGLPTTLRTDPTRLRQILINLLGNAAKFTTVGSIDVRILAASSGAGLRIEVVDTGPGVPADQRDLLFQDFERLESDASRLAEGAGLGLAVSNRLATLLGGQLGHQPNPGGGSIFWLELPQSAERAPDPIPESRSEMNPERLPSRALHVLIVDDVIINRDVASAFLKAAGHSATCAEDGISAVAAAADADFDVVLMDVRMPGMDGLEATRQIRALPGPRGRVPIVALTAQAFADQIAACQEAGMGSHLSKPFAREALLAAVEQAHAAQRTIDRPEILSDRLCNQGGANVPLLERRAFERTAGLMKPAEVASHLETMITVCRNLSAELGVASASGPEHRTIADDAHRLAGIAGMFGFRRLASVGQQLEYALETKSEHASLLRKDMCEAIDASIAEARLLTREARADSNGA